MSLREQLLKSGLATKEQAKRAQREAKHRQHQAIQTLRKQARGDEQSGPSEAEILMEAQREADRIRNLQLQEERLQKEAIARATDIMVNNDLCDPKADINYAFVLEEKRIATIRITELQVSQLASGQIAIAAFDPEYRFFLVSETNADKIRECHPNLIVCQHKGSAQSQQQH